MRTFFALQKDKSINSDWQQCLSWARQRIKEDSTAIQLLKARGGDKDAVVIAEITVDCERMIHGGRTLSVRRFVNGKS